MCKIDKDGITFSNGDKMKFFDLDFETLSKEQMEELYNANMSMYDGLSIRKNIHDLRNEIQHILNKLDVNLIEMQKHTASCPIAKTKINLMIQTKINEHQVSEVNNDFLIDKWNEILKNKIFSTASIMKALTAIVIFFSLFFTVAFKIAQTLK